METQESMISPSTQPFPCVTEESCETVKDSLKDYYDCLAVLSRDHLVSETRALLCKSILDCYRCRGKLSPTNTEFRKDEERPKVDEDCSHLLLGTYFPFRTLLELYLKPDLALIPTDWVIPERPASSSTRFHGIQILRKEETDSSESPCNVVASSPNLPFYPAKEQGMQQKKKKAVKERT